MRDEVDLKLNLGESLTQQMGHSRLTNCPPTHLNFTHFFLFLNF